MKRTALIGTGAALLLALVGGGVALDDFASMRDQVAEVQRDWGISPAAARHAYRIEVSRGPMAASTWYAYRSFTGRDREVLQRYSLGHVIDMVSAGTGTDTDRTCALAVAREVLEDPLCTTEQLWLGATAVGLLGESKDPDFAALIDGQMERLNADAETRAWVAESRGGPVSPHRARYGGM